MKWETKIQKETPDGVKIKGYDLVELVGKISFTEIIFLLFTDKIPTPDQKAVLDAIFVSSAVHSITVPSITSARIVQSSGNPLNASIAAGILAIGDYHGGAIEPSARLFQENIGDDPSKLVSDMLSQKKRLPGYGHKKYKKDPRVAPLFELAQKHNVAGKHIEFAKKIDDILCEQTKKDLHLNIDGAMAAILSDLGIDWQAARAFFIIPRTAGIAAHAVEERTSGEVYRREDESNVTYSGPPDRKL